MLNEYIYDSVVSFSNQDYNNFANEVHNFAENGWPTFEESDLDKILKVCAVNVVVVIL